MAYRYLSYEDRKTIESLYSAGMRLPEIADKIGFSLRALYKDLDKGATGELNEIGRRGYSAELAQRVTQDNIKRRGTKNN